MANFRRRNDEELKRLDDEALLASVADASAAGDAGAVEAALAILVTRYEADVRRRVRAKVPESDVDDVVQNCLMSAIFSSIQGRSIGEFRKWLNRIVSRRIADYHRRPGLETSPLPEEHADDEEIWGEVAGIEDETAAVEVRELVEVVLAKLSEPHRRVIDLFVFERFSAEETKDAVNEGFPDLNPPMSVDNVSQIAKRFRDDLRDLLEEPDNPD